MMSERFKLANERANPEHKAFVKKNLDVVEQIMYLLKDNNWTQKMLAQELGKSESEISRWLSGLHNFTFQTIIKLEQVLKGAILVTPIKYHQLVIKEVQHTLVSELVKLESFWSLKLQSQVLTHRSVPSQSWQIVSPISTKTSFTRNVLKRKSGEAKVAELPLEAA